MADSKISNLTSATTPLAGTEILPIVQSSTTKQVSVADLTAGRAVSVASLTASGVVSSQGLQAATTPSLSFGASKWMTQYEGSNTSRTYICGDSAGSYGVWQVYTATSTGAPIETIKFDGSSNVTVTTGNIIQGTAAKGINFTANTAAAGMTSQLLNWYEEGTWTVTWTNLTGTPSNLTGYYTRIGRVVHFTYSAGATTVTATAASTRFSLPFTPSIEASGTQISQNVDKSFTTLILPSNSSCYVGSFTSNYMVFTGTYIV